MQKTDNCWVFKLTSNSINIFFDYYNLIKPLKQNPEKFKWKTTKFGKD